MHKISDFRYPDGSDVIWFHYSIAKDNCKHICNKLTTIYLCNFFNITIKGIDRLKSHDKKGRVKLVLSDRNFSYDLVMVSPLKTEMITNNIITVSTVIRLTHWRVRDITLFFLGRKKVRIMASFETVEKIFKKFINCKSIFIKSFFSDHPNWESDGMKITDFQFRHFLNLKIIN